MAYVGIDGLLMYWTSLIKGNSLLEFTFDGTSWQKFIKDNSLWQVDRNLSLKKLKNTYKSLK